MFQKRLYENCYSIAPWLGNAEQRILKSISFYNVYKPNNINLDSI